jgi:hypothetical protein
MALVSTLRVSVRSPRFLRFKLGLVKGFRTEVNFGRTRHQRNDLCIFHYPGSEPGGRWFESSELGNRHHPASCAPLEQHFLRRLACLQHRMKNERRPGQSVPVHAPATNPNHRADPVGYKPIPVFLNSKEEIGWKVVLQNSNLWHEVV